MTASAPVFVLNAAYCRKFQLWPVKNRFGKPRSPAHTLFETPPGLPRSPAALRGFLIPASVSTARCMSEIFRCRRLQLLLRATVRTPFTAATPDESHIGLRAVPFWRPDLLLHDVSYRHSQVWKCCAGRYLSAFTAPWGGSSERSF